MSYHNMRVRGRGRYLDNRNTRGNDKYKKMAHPVELSRPNVSKKNISKHDNNCCSEISISLELDEGELSFFNELKNMFNMLKKSPPVVSKLHTYFHTSGNPYTQVLKLLCNCQEFYNAKTKSLPIFIIEEFKSWSTTNRSRIIHLLTPQMKFDAFKVSLKQNTLQLIKLLIDVFELKENKEIFLDIIKCLIEKKQFKEACQYASLLNLHSYFTIDDFLIPLVLQDRMHGVDEFLKNSPRHQTELVRFLDNALASTSVRDVMGHYALGKDIPDLRYDKMHAKPWKKAISRLVKMFKLPPELTPNLNKRRNEGALSFLLHKRYSDNTFGVESWKEMVQEAVGEDADLQVELVQQVAQHDLSEALRWAHFYNLDRKDWPHRVRMLEENPDENRQQQRNFQQEVENWDNEIDQLSVTTEFHKLKLPTTAIILIDNPEKFENFLDKALQDVDIIGIDCEWKPSFGGQLNELALMQVATRKNVFILDIINIGNKCPHLWQELGKFVFNNCDILKLGFSLTSDNHMIRHALPNLNFTAKQVGFLDLCSFWKTLDKHPEVKLPFEVQKGGPSLSNLVHHCLGAPLDKSDQFSNWEKRPLRESQIVYAAIDAYCLIECYDVLRKCCENANFPFDETCYNLMTNEKSTRKNLKNKIGNKRKPPPISREDIPQPPSPHVSHIRAEELKVVCDSMLQGLGKKLRSFGIDAAILDNDDDHMRCVRYAMDENRYILTKGYETFKQLNGYVQKGHCLKLNSDNVDEQIKQVIEYYKVVITKENVFSRCKTCNGNSFVRISKSTMLVLSDLSKKKFCGAAPCYYEDEATGFSSDDDYVDYLTAPPPIPARKWDLVSDEKIDVGLCQTRLGAKIQVDNVPQPIINQYDLFYVCEECGKVYWDGTHFNKVITGRLQGIVQ